MQRKAKVDETRRQHSEKQKKLENEFSTSFAKRLKSNSGEKDRSGFEAKRTHGRRPETKSPRESIVPRVVGKYPTKREHVIHLFISEIPWC